MRNLWAGTEEGGMVRYRDGRFSNVRGGAGRRIDSIDGGMDGNGVMFLSGPEAFRLSDGAFLPFAPLLSLHGAPHVIGR